MIGKIAIGKKYCCHLMRPNDFDILGMGNIIEIGKEKAEKTAKELSKKLENKKPVIIIYDISSDEAFQTAQILSGRLKQRICVCGCSLNSVDDIHRALLSAKREHDNDIVPIMIMEKEKIEIFAWKYLPNIEQKKAPKIKKHMPCGTIMTIEYVNPVLTILGFLFKKAKVTYTS